MKEPFIDQISPALLRAFGYMIENPERWITAEEIAQATGTSKATIHRRFKNLADARALRVRQMEGFRHFKLHPLWNDSTLGVRVGQRCAQVQGRAERHEEG